MGKKKAIDAMSEIDQLRRELRDVRYLVEAVLMSIVGRDKMSTYELEARVESHMKRARRGTPLREVGVGGLALDGLTSSRGGMDVQTLEEVSWYSRDRISALDGVGPSTMRKLDDALAERGLTWSEA